MAVYVDDMRANFGRMVMCHMIADTPEELRAMAMRIGVAQKWIQHEGTFKEHFDIAQVKKKSAIYQGAIPITWRETAAMCQRRRITGSLGNPNDAVAWLIEYHRQQKESGNDGGVATAEPE